MTHEYQTMESDHTTPRILLCLVVCIGIDGLWAFPAHSQPKLRQSASYPWFKGVPAHKRERAGELFTAGADEHIKLKYATALEKYQQALAEWDNPDIHFNMARAYLNSGKPVAAYESLVRSMSFGEHTLEPEDLDLARQYLASLDEDLAHVEVTCELTGAQITVDDQPLFSGPGTRDKVLLPGPHQLRATRTGHLPADRWLQLRAGERKRIALTPTSLERVAVADVSCEEPEATIMLAGKLLVTCPGQKSEILTPDTAHTFTISRPGRRTDANTVKPKAGDRLTIKMATLTDSDFVTTRRMKSWLPWSVVGSSAVVGLLGGYLEKRAFDNMNAYDLGFEANCPEGCTAGSVPDAMVAQKKRAVWQNRVGVSLMVAGGLGLVAGVTAALLNQPKIVRRERLNATAISITPTVDDGRIGVQARFGF